MGPNIATIFLSPLTEGKLPGITYYLGHQEHEPEVWGEFLYVRTKYSIIEISSALGMTFEYVQITAEENVYKARLSAEDKEVLITPIVEGKFSEISTTLVKSLYSSTKYLELWKICNKSVSYRLAIEKYLDVKLEPNVELFSKPLKENEILNYEISGEYQPENFRTKFGLSQVS